jgi:hypothetical protein
VSTPGHLNRFQVLFLIRFLEVEEPSKFSSACEETRSTCCPSAPYAEDPHTQWYGEIICKDGTITAKVNGVEYAGRMSERSGAKQRTFFMGVASSRGIWFVSRAMAC